MIIWIDAQLSPSLAPWLQETYGVSAAGVAALGLRDASDVAIFEAARDAGAVVMTKDADFPQLVRERGAPPKVIWIRLGNTSNARLRTALARVFSGVKERLEAGEDVVEVRDVAAPNGTDGD